MSEFELLKALQNELIRTLEERSKTKDYENPRSVCKTKIRRLRLQIQEVMLSIEKQCNNAYKLSEEAWYKDKN